MDEIDKQLADLDTQRILLFQKRKQLVKESFNTKLSHGVIYRIMEVLGRNSHTLHGWFSNFDDAFNNIPESYNRQFFVVCARIDNIQESMYEDILKHLDVPVKIQ